MNQLLLLSSTNPCGVATSEKISNAWKTAYECDSKSAFRGIVVFNRIIDEQIANSISNIFRNDSQTGINDEAKNHQKINLRILVSNKFFEHDLDDFHIDLSILVVIQNKDNYKVFR